MPRGAPSPSVGVVGHVEWVTHALGRVPGPGDIVDLAEPLTEPAGGGAVAAVAMARATGGALLMTAMGDDRAAGRAETLLARHGVQVEAAHRSAPQTPVLSITAPTGERTIMVVGPRLQPRADDALPWARLGELDAVYYAGEDPAALERARRAGVLVVSARRLGDTRAAGVRADVVVASAADGEEDPWGLPPHLAPSAIVLTEGSAGGVIHHASGAVRRYAPVRPPGPVVDTYGCGDSFAGVLAAALGHGAALDAAAAAGARAGALCATWRGGLGPLA